MQLHHRPAFRQPRPDRVLRGQPPLLLLRRGTIALFGNHQPSHGRRNEAHQCGRLFQRGSFRRRQFVCGKGMSSSYGLFNRKLHRESPRHSCSVHRNEDLHACLSNHSGPYQADACTAVRAHASSEPEANKQREDKYASVTPGSFIQSRSVPASSQAKPYRDISIARCGRRRV